MLNTVNAGGWWKELRGSKCNSLSELWPLRPLLIPAASNIEIELAESPESMSMSISFCARWSLQDHRPFTLESDGRTKVRSQNLADVRLQSWKCSDSGDLWSTSDLCFRPKPGDQLKDISGYVAKPGHDLGQMWIKVAKYESFCCRPPQHDVIMDFTV